jgi:hypothetical protein
MRGLAFVRAWNTKFMQGHAKFVALGLAVLVFGVFQLPQGAVAQIKPVQEAKTTKKMGDQAQKQMAAAEPEKVDPMAAPSPSKKQLPNQPEGAPAAQAPLPTPPKISSIGELISMVGMTRSPEKPFADKGVMAQASKPVMAYAAFRSAVGSKGGPAKLSGRRVHVKGVVLSMVRVGTAFSQMLLADSDDRRMVACLVTLPRGAENSFEIGKVAELDAIFGQAVWRPGYKGTLLTMLGGSWDKWQDEGMSQAELGATFLRANPALEPASADPKASTGLSAWHLYGQVEHQGAGTMLMTRTDGRKIYAQDGQLLEPGIRVLRVNAESVTLRVDNHEVTVRPW